MNRFFRNLTVLALASSLSLTPFAPTATWVSDNDEAVTSHDITLDAYLLENYGSTFLENYHDSLDMIATFYDELPSDITDEVIYPEYFGGLYINDEGELVILKLEDEISNDQTSISNFEDAVIESVEFSYQELVETMDFLNAIANGSEQFDTLISLTNTWSLDVINNQVLVSLIDYNPEEVARFQQEILDSPVIVFEQTSLADHEYSSEAFEQQWIFPVNVPNPPTSPRPASAGTAIRTGDRIFSYRTGVGYLGGLSAGYRALGPNGEMGFVTAAHVPGGAQIGDIITNYNGTRLGVVQRAQLPGIDAAFVVLDPGVSITSRTNLAAGGNYNGVVGQRVRTYGATSGAPRVGTILTSHMSAIMSGGGNGLVVITDAIRATGLGLAGDSGAVVYTIDAAGHVTGTAGIHLGITIYSFISRADSINSAFNLRLVQGGEPSPQTPGAPAPTVPGVPGVPPVPGVPGVPGVPPVPGVPGIPPLP